MYMLMIRIVEVDSNHDQLDLDMAQLMNIESNFHVQQIRDTNTVSWIAFAYTSQVWTVDIRKSTIYLAYKA